MLPPVIHKWLPTSNINNIMVEMRPVGKQHFNNSNNLVDSLANKAVNHSHKAVIREPKMIIGK
jgi:hypothetical protein